jgi:hypothetical protein
MAFPFSSRGNKTAIDLLGDDVDRRLHCLVLKTEEQVKGMGV